VIAASRDDCARRALLPSSHIANASVCSSTFVNQHDTNRRHERDRPVLCARPRYDGKRFIDVARDVGVDVKGETRQVSWIDFDKDGRKDSTFLNARAAARPLSSTAARRK